MDFLKSNLEFFVARSGMNQNAFAVACGVKQPNLHRILSGEVGSPRDSTIIKIATYLNISVSDLRYKDFSNQAPQEETARYNAGKPISLPRGRYVAIVGTAKGGADGYFSIDDYPQGQGDGEILTHSRDENAYAIRVRGDSMRPRIKSGEYIIAEPTVEAQPGDDVVVRLKDDRAMVKELLWMRDGEVSLGSINNGVAPITLPLNEIKSIHRVAAIIPRGSALLK